MNTLIRENPIGRFSRGFFSPFRSLSLLRRKPRLLTYILIPFLINLAVFTGAVYLGLDFFGGTVVEHIPQGDAWYWSILSWFLWVIAVLLTAVLVFFTFTVVGNLIASPFNDLLSERTEQILTGRETDEAFSLRRFFGDAGKTLLMELKKMWVFVLAMLLILPLNLLPGFGSALYTMLAIFLTLFFLSIEYLSFIMVRKHQFFNEQRRFIFARKFMMLGFSCGIMVLLAVPFLQFFCIPLAVIGATRLWCDEHGLTKDNFRQVSKESNSTLPHEAHS
ncbi:MAG TPA: EI24 domain-containing protein [Desulfuromonadales bacterium]|nr:EI24 domain-containing protein [Desulfuromonadales bacterium]